MNQQLFREDANDGALREAYLRLSLGQMDLRIGKQLIIWGRADCINPTDNLTPRNVTLLVPVMVSPGPPRLIGLTERILLEVYVVCGSGLPRLACCRREDVREQPANFLSFENWGHGHTADLDRSFSFEQSIDLATVYNPLSG